MTARKKPRAAKVAPAPVEQFTADQLRVAQLFGLMSDAAQSHLLPMIEAVAREMPRHVRPALRLVGGAK